MKKFLCVFFSIFFVFSCFAVGASADDVNNNITVINQDIGGQPTHKKCDYCGSEFTTQDEYVKHSVDCCANENSGAGIRCCACNDYFTTYSLLKSHENTRNGVTINNFGKIVCKYAGNGCETTCSSMTEYKEHIDSCVYKSIWTLLKAGKIKEALKLVPWSKILEVAKKVINVVKGIDLSGVGNVLKSVFNTVKDLLGKVDWSSLLGKVKGVFNK